MEHNLVLVASCEPVPHVLLWCSCEEGDTNLGESPSVDDVVQAVNAHKEQFDG